METGEGWYCETCRGVCLYGVLRTNKHEDRPVRWQGESDPGEEEA
mgnify:FL=1